MVVKCVRRTFLTPEWSQDIFLIHVSSSLVQMKQHIQNEAHNLAGSTPSLPCPLSKLRQEDVPDSLTHWQTTFRTFYKRDDVYLKTS